MLLSSRSVVGLVVLLLNWLLTSRGINSALMLDILRTITQSC